MLKWHSLKSFEDFEKILKNQILEELKNLQKKIREEKWNTREN